MFATLAGGYPRPDLGPDATPDDLVRAVIAEQEEAGLEILSDGHVRWDDRIGALAERIEGLELGEPEPYFDTGTTYRRPLPIREPRWDGPILLDGWKVAAAASPLPVKATIVGPYTLAYLCAPGAVGRDRLTMVLADVLSHELRSLFQAGCPLVQVDEDAAGLLAGSPREQQLFKSAQRRLTHDLRTNHMSLAVPGADLSAIPPDIYYDALYRSYFFDLSSGPDNWRLIVNAPAERGIVAGVANARTDAPDDPAFLIWAAMYAASMRGRGPDRVAIAPSGSLAGLGHAAARAKLDTLGAAAAEFAERMSSEGATLDLASLAQEGVANGWLPRAPATLGGAESA
jgi:5-methyltetrahydropteroyltriglutamate--homocysteine methyltransferase